MSLPACPLITFYSYKGGVGRSQTLANVAVALANRGKNVIMVDFDLESPGLHRYFSPLEHPEKRLGEEELNQKGGLLDWLSKAKTVPEDEPFITDHLIDCTSHALRPGRGWLKLIACGAQTEIGGRGYSGRVRDFNWRQFEEEAYGQDYLELMRRQLKGVKGADYILLDSRTGVTDVGMLCTFVLPDVVVMLFALHDQGISGVRWLAGRLKEHQEKMKKEADSEFSYPQKILLVPTRVEETQELDLRDHWIQRARAALAGEGHVWLGEYGQRLPYLPKAAFGENIVVSPEDEGTELGAALEKLTVTLLTLSKFDEDVHTPLTFEQIEKNSEIWEHYDHSYKQVFQFFRGIQDSTPVELIAEKARELSRLNGRRERLHRELMEQLRPFLDEYRLSEESASVPIAHLDSNAPREYLHSVMRHLRDALTRSLNEAYEQLRSVVEDSQTLEDEREAHRRLLYAGAFKDGRESLESRLEWFRRESTEGKLRRNALERAQFEKRYPNETDQRSWLERHLQETLEDASSEFEQQRLILRNLLRLYPSLQGRPSKQQWDAWDTLCMLSEADDISDKSTLMGELFQEIGRSLWEAEWNEILNTLNMDEVGLSSEAGPDARRQLKEIIEHHEALVEDLSTELASRFLKWLNEGHLEAVLTLVRARRDDPLLLVVLEALCRLALEDVSPWLLKLSASLLLELGFKHQGFWEPFLERLIQKGHEREAFYFLVAMTHMEREVVTESPAIRDLPTRFVLSLSSDHPPLAKGLSLLMQEPSMKALLELTSAGKATLNVWETSAQFPLSVGETSSDSQFVKKLDEAVIRARSYSEPSLTTRWPSSRYYAPRFKSFFSDWIDQLIKGDVSYQEMEEQLDRFDLDEWIAKTYGEEKQLGRKIFLPDELEKRAFVASKDKVIKHIRELNELRKEQTVSLESRRQSYQSKHAQVEQLCSEIRENDKIPPEICKRLTGQAPTHAVRLNTEPQRITWPSRNDLLLKPELLKLSAELLDVEEGNTAEHFERFARHFLEYWAGRRTEEHVAKQLLEARRFQRLCTLLIQHPLREVEQKFRSQWRETLQEFVTFIEETLVVLAQLKAQGLTEAELQELNDWLELLRTSLDGLPQADEARFLESLQGLGPDPLTDLISYKTFVLEARQVCQSLIVQRQEQARRRVLALKTQIDQLINQLEFLDPPLAADLLEGLSRIRMRASEGLRRRDIALLENLEADLRQSLEQPEHLSSWSMPEPVLATSTVPTGSERLPPSAAGPLTQTGGMRTGELSAGRADGRVPSEPNSIPRLSAGRLRERREQLSEWFRRDLEARKQKVVAGASRSSDQVVLNWERERLEPHRLREDSLLQVAGDMAALHPDELEGMRALTVWLLCRVFQHLKSGRFERLLELSTEALSLLELPGLKLPQHEKWLQHAQRLNIVALRLTFTGERPEEERLYELLDLELELQLNELEQRGLVPELSGVMLQLGLRESDDAVLDRLLPWFRREPLPTATLLETLCEDAQLLARHALLGATSDQAWLGLRAPLIAVRQGLKLLKRLELLTEIGDHSVLTRLQKVEQQLLLRPALSRVVSLLDTVLEECLAPLQSDSRPMLVGVLATAIQGLRKELAAPSREVTGLTHRMLTSKVLVKGTSQPFLVVELHYLKGPCTLKEVQTEAILLDREGTQIAGGIKPIAPLPRVPVGQVREVRIPLNPYAEKLLDARQLFIRQFSRGDDGNKQFLNLRIENLKVTLESVETSPSPTAANPFVVGSPIQQYDQIYGRDEQVEHLRQTLMGAHQDQVVMVMGERRSGKTTLLNKLKKHPSIQPRYWILDVDLQHIMEAERMADFFRERFALPIQRLLHRNGIGSPELPNFDRSPGPAFSGFMGEVDLALKKRDKRLLLIIDELERLFECIERREARSGDVSLPESGQSELSRTTVAILRDVLQKMERISFVLAGVTPVLRRFTTHKGERLFKLAVEVECKTLSPEACIQLICEPVKSHYEVLQLAYQHIIRETGRQPYLIQLVCSEVFRYAMKHQLKHITRLHVEQVLDELVPQRRHFSYLNDDVKDPEHYRIVRAVAMVQRGNTAVPFPDISAMLERMGHRMPPEKLFDTLKYLELNAPQVLERRVGTRDTFRLTVGLYARHLRTLLREERW